MPRKVDRSCDFFVVFGITGDLAKVMTFHSLYRLEQRGLSIVRSSASRSTTGPDKDLREHARKAIETSSGAKPDPKVFNRLAKRLLLRAGRLRGRRDLRAPRRGDQGRPEPGLLPRDPAVAVRDDDQGPGRRGLTKNARVVVEKPFGHDLESARALAEEIHQYINEDQLYRIDHFLGLMGLDGDPLPPLRERDVRAPLGPQQRRLRPDHDGRGLRGRRPRSLLRPGRRAPGRRRQTT